MTNSLSGLRQVNLLYACALTTAEETHPVAALSADTFKSFISEAVVSLPDQPESAKRIKVLGDTGSSQSLILHDVLPLSDATATGYNIYVQGIDCGETLAPLHRLHLSHSFVQGNVILGVMSEMPVKDVHLLLGNDLAGTQVFPPGIAQKPLSSSDIVLPPTHSPVQDTVVKSTCELHKLSTPISQSDSFVKLDGSTKGKEHHEKFAENGLLRNSRLFFRLSKIIVGVVFVILSLPMFMSMIMTGIDNVRPILYYLCGYALPERPSCKPMDLTMFDSPYEFLFDYSLFLRTIAYVSLCIISGLFNSGIWYLWIKINIFRRTDTGKALSS